MPSFFRVTMKEQVRGFHQISLGLFIVLFQFTQAVQVKTPEHCSCEFTNSTATINIKCDTEHSKHEIFKCFQNLGHAKSLIFTDSGLRRIPGETQVLKNLTYLDLSRNNIDVFNLEPLGQVCHSLKYLLLSNNHISKLKKGSMDCLGSLVRFHLDNNSLALIENGTFNSKLKKLEATYIMYNSLTSLDSSLIYLPMFNEGKDIVVNASRNKISLATNSVNFTILDIDKEKKFHVILTHNNFTTINLEYYIKLLQIENIFQLYRLWNSGADLRFNPLVCDCKMEIIAEMLGKFRPIMDPDNPVFSITCREPPSLSGMMIYKVPLNQFNCSVTSGCPIGCSCTKTVKLGLITIYCDNRYKSKTLPQRVPEIKTTQLNIKSETLTELSDRSYLRNTSLLDVSGCALDTISTNILPRMSRIQLVRLHDNALTQIPKEIQATELSGLKSLTLRGNPFSCDCHSLWFKKWLLSNKRLISDIDRVLCGSGPGKGKQIIGVNDVDFKCDVSLTTNEVLIIVFSVVFVMVVFFVFIHHNRMFLQVMLIAYFNIFCFRRKAHGDFPYDVFISHSSKDDVWVIETLFKKLESQKPPYKIFFDERDFEPGKTIIYNVIRAIKLSRTTLLVLTNNFLRSDWCMMEFKQAYLKLLKDNDINFIVIIMEELDQALIGQELKFYLRTHVYIKYTDKYFWPKLLQALPMACPNTDGSFKPGVSERTPLL